MELNTEKGPRVGSPDEIHLIQSQVQVVVYDEDQPPEAHAVPIQDTTSSSTLPVRVVAEPFPKEIVPVDVPLPSGVPHSNVPQSTTNRTDITMRDDGFDCLLCGDTRLRRLRPGFHLALSLCGNTFVDLLDSVLPVGSKITILSLRLCGNTQLLVPPGTRVIVRRIMLCGNRDVDVDDDPELDPTQPAPRLVVYILSLCGDIRARSNREDMSGPFRS